MASSEKAEKAASDLAALAAEEKTAELSILKESLDESRRQSADRYDQLLRLKAEFENFRKRSDREKADARRWGKEEVVLRLVSVLDVLEQAEAAALKGADPKAVSAGLDMLYKEFKRFLKDEGVEEVGGEGEAFDPALHEAVDIVERDGDPDRVTAVLQKGYRFQGALLRPARVQVARAKGASRTDAP